MMQTTDLVLDLILLSAIITFYGTVAWGLIRYSKRQGYRLWAIGWLVYTIGAFQGGFMSTATGLAPQDIIAISLMFIGGSLILDGIRATELTKKRLQNLAIGVILFSCFFLLGLVFNLGFQFIFMPLGFYIVYVCIASSRTVIGFESVGDISNWWLIIGFLIWATSWLIAPLTIFNFDIFHFFIFLQALGVIITGSSMLTLFTRTVTKDLETQYQISQIISGLVQHDIRNYIQTASHALELTEGENLVENHWINIASDVLVDAGHFVDEMRDISVSISQAKSPSEKVPLTDIVGRAKDRVVKEYKLNDEQVQVQIPADASIKNSRLIDELLWNIFDNAFKHGSPSILVQAKASDSNEVELEISDRGSGLPRNIKSFLNSTDALSKPDKPLVGLGVLLIRGISSLCNIHLIVSDNVEDISVIGTTYNLKFNGTH
ncbi:MAG: ATP-binding protein [Candidatus Thorarchaeota archaeon]